MTYSIVARDPATGEIGVAVQTHQPAVGAIVPWVDARRGAVATQSFANINFGPQILGLLARGLDARGALTAVLAADDMPARRQVAVIPIEGAPAVHTGADCIPFAAHQAGEHYSVQANMMLTDRVPPAMARAFEGTQGVLAVRLLEALKAAQAEGGDIRGSQSAAILVRAPGPLSHTWDLRVDNDAAPLEKLEQLVNVRRAGAMIASAAPDDVAALEAAYQAADALAGSDEQTFWFAVRSLGAAGETVRGLDLLQPIFKRAPQWRELLLRLEIPEAAALKSRLNP